MKRIAFLLVFSTIFILSSCIDTEEDIVINADQSGNYAVSIDMGKMLEMMSQFGGRDSSGQKMLPKKDTTIYFKDLVSASDKLTEEEKVLYKDGFVKLKIDEASNEIKMVIGCPFSNVSKLPEIKKNLFAVSEKLGIKNIIDDKASKEMPSSDDLMGNNADLGESVNPSAKAYEFSAVPGKISNKSVGQSVTVDQQANDSTMQMMQQMTMLMGEMTMKTVITLPNEPKKISNPKAVLSADKRTITFSNTLSGLMEKPAEGEYEIEY